MLYRIILILFLVPFFGVMFAQTSMTKVIAHRGFWQTENSAQNSLASLTKASEIGVYGSETDVHITKDGVLVIHHDDSINGQLIEATDYTEFQKTTLANGENLPTLKSYLETLKKLNKTRLILEIKPHQTPEMEAYAVKKTVELVKSMHLESRVEYLSFSPTICTEILKINPHANIAYLNGDISPYEIQQMGITGIDYHYKVFEQNPTWLEEAKQLHLTTNAWTVNDTNVMRTLILQKIDAITTDRPLDLQRMLRP